MAQVVGELDTAQVEHVLKRRNVGRLSCQGDGFRYVTPVSYHAFDLPDVYVHLDDAACLRIIRANPNVKFEVDDIASPSQWETVIGWGRLEELDAAAAQQHARHGKATLYRIHLDPMRGFYRGAGAAFHAD